MLHLASAAGLLTAEQNSQLKQWPQNTTQRHLDIRMGICYHMLGWFVKLRTASLSLPL